MPRPTSARGRLLPAVAALAAALAIGGCSALRATPPAPTPADFPGLAGVLAQRGVLVTDYVSGDPGCDDPTLAPTAIRFEATGFELAEGTTIRIYIFRNREAYERRRGDVDICALAWAGDPAAIEAIDVSPYVLVGSGPWPPEFKRALRDGLIEAGGTGG
ncbi:MAG: hypothetical protein AABZ33_03120 [Chloroflexota bacterium]